MSQSLLKLMSIESVMPSHHLILGCPLLLLPSIFSSTRVFSNQGGPGEGSPSVSQRSGLAACWLWTAGLQRPLCGRAKAWEQASRTSGTQSPCFLGCPSEPPSPPVAFMQRQEHGEQTVSSYKIKAQRAGCRGPARICPTLWGSGRPPSHYGLGLTR